MIEVLDCGRRCLERGDTLGIPPSEARFKRPSVEIKEVDGFLPTGEKNEALPADSVSAGGSRERAIAGVCSDNAELISSAHNPGQLSECRVKEPSRGRSSDGSLFVHASGVNARDQHIGNAEPTRTTRTRSTEQATRPDIDPGAVGVRYWPKRYRGRLYDAVQFRDYPAELQQLARTVAGSFRSNVGCGLRRFFRRSVSERQQLGRTAFAAASFRSEIGHGCRQYEGYSARPACFAERE